MINRRGSLSEELYKMKKLAGLVLESRLDETQAKLSAGTGMVLKLDNDKKSEIDSIEIPEEPNGAEMTKLPSDMFHITLTSVKNMNNLKDVGNKYFNIPIYIQNIKYYLESPKIELGEARFVYRDENGGRSYSTNGKVTYVVAIKNQSDLRDFVNSIYKELGLENPEPNRFYHITIANNMEGDSMKSIGDVNELDFK